MQESELIDRLVSFVSTDTILFLPDSAEARKAVAIVNRILRTKFVISEGIEVLEGNSLQSSQVKKYLEQVSFDKLALVYLTAMELRSVLLGILFAEKGIGIEDAFACAFYEELSQQHCWGCLPEILQKQQSIKNRLKLVQEWFGA
ncbi:hypothetical protein IJ556_08235 [bacterium]|nr:hypothetical protein [bacterium]